MFGNAIVGSQIEFLGFTQHKAQAATICIVQSAEVELTRDRRDFSGCGECHHANAPEEQAAVFGLISHETFVGIPAAIISPHHIGAAEFFQFPKRGIPKSQACNSLHSQYRLRVEVDEFPDVCTKHLEIKVTADETGEPDVLKLRRIHGPGYKHY